jgi:capsule polysaccharide modification protein KpsS
MALIESGKEFHKENNHQKLKKRMENMEVTQYTLRIPVNLYKQVKIKLANDSKKLRGVLLEMLEEYIKK